MGPKNLRSAVGLITAVNRRNWSLFTVSLTELSNINQRVIPTKRIGFRKPAPRGTGTAGGFHQMFLNPYL